MKWVLNCYGSDTAGSVRIRALYAAQERSPLPTQPTDIAVLAWMHFSVYLWCTPSCEQTRSGTGKTKGTAESGQTFGYAHRKIPHTTMDVSNFTQIAPRCGGQREAFEELCCQLARLGRPSGSTFVRLRGSGGDGGVECYADLKDAGRVGWQAKFLFDVDALLKQLAASLDTALQIHPKLERYVVCFPFDPTGPTGRKGRNGVEKFEEWRQRSQEAARKKGRQLVIEDWPASRLLSELLKNDASGGLWSYFFDATVFSESWFKQHLETVLLAAGPRYTPKLTVETSLWKWFSALGHTTDWSRAFSSLLKRIEAALEDLRSTVERGRPSPMDPEWPEELRTKATSCVSNLASLSSAFSGLVREPSRKTATQCVSRISQSLSELRELESGLLHDLEAHHGKGNADSPGFRQFMAEYQVSFPTANLDAVREVSKTVQTLTEWLNSPAGWSAFETTFLLLGSAGAGKTHGVCDAATRRFDDGRLSLVTFGHCLEENPTHGLVSGNISGSLELSDETGC